MTTWQMWPAGGDEIQPHRWLYGPGAEVPQERPVPTRVPGSTPPDRRVPWAPQDPDPSNLRAAPSFAGPQDWAPTPPGIPAMVIADLPVAPCARREPHAAHDHSPIPSLHCPGIPSPRTTERLNDTEALADLLAELDDDEGVHPLGFYQRNAATVLEYLRNGR